MYNDVYMYGDMYICYGTVWYATAWHGMAWYGSDVMKCSVM